MAEKENEGRRGATAVQEKSLLQRNEEEEQIKHFYLQSLLTWPNGHHDAFTV